MRRLLNATDVERIASRNADHFYFGARRQAIAFISDRLKFYNAVLH